MKKSILIGLIGLSAIVGCSDPSGSEPRKEETTREYFYRVEVPNGFSADLLYFYHTDPESIQKATDLIEGVKGSWKTDTYEVNPLSRTPYAELRISRTRKIDYTQEIYGQLKAQIVVDGIAVKDTVWQLPAGLGSFSVGYNFSNN